MPIPLGEFSREPSGISVRRLGGAVESSGGLTICVFCGSASGQGRQYMQAAEDFGRALAARQIGLVFGGARSGLMGVIADTVLAQKGRVAGVIPQGLVDRELAHLEVSPLYVVQDMHQRKAQMEKLSDGFVALPGGSGTLEELAEVWTWGQLGLHGKPCGLLNVAGYYDPFVAFLDHMSKEGFLAAPYRDMVLISSDPEDLLDQMAAYRPPPVKWLSAAAGSSEAGC